MTDGRFARAEALLGSAAMDRLAGCHVAVFGLGGVGSWAAEALARTGIGALTLVDDDTVSLTNINRQLPALSDTVGQFKAEVLAARLRAISPEAQIRPLVCHYQAETREELLADRYDYLIDAIDLVSCKLDLILSARERAIPVISCLGTGNRLRASGFRVSDISQTKDDPLARVVRRELRKRGVEHCPVLWAPGLTEKPSDTGETPPEGRRSIPGSVCWVPASAGLLLAEHVVLSLTEPLLPNDP